MATNLTSPRAEWAPVNNSTWRASRRNKLMQNEKKVNNDLKQNHEILHIMMDVIDQAKKKNANHSDSASNDN